MNSRLVLLPYKETSGGSKQMAKALGIERVLREDRFDPEEPTVCLNWGRGDLPRWYGNVQKFINSPEAVYRAIDKLVSFKAFTRTGVPTVPWTTKESTAIEWTKEGKIVFCRTSLHGMDGDGLVIAKKPDDVVYSALYTQYIPKRSEYRIHAMNGTAFYGNRKHMENPNADKMIRTTSGGWYFRHLDDLPSEIVCKAAALAVEALGLDFGGVDVGESEDGQAFVYEVNTAPEMGPNTTAAYKRAFQKHHGNYKNKDGVLVSDL